MQGLKFVKMKIPCFFMMFTWLPIFVLLYFVPSFAETEGYRSIDEFIDQHLFGTVGTWSSLFPLPSKLVTNYICLFAPVFAIVFTYLTLKRSTFESANFDRLAWRKIVLSVIAVLVLLMVITYIYYIGDNDLGKIQARYHFVGRWRITYALWSCGSLYLIYVISLVSYVFIRYLPAVIYHRVKAFK